MKFFKRRSRGTYLTLVLILTSTINTYGPAQATTFFDSNFEGSGPEADGWGYTGGGAPCTGSPCAWLDVSTDVARAGSKSLKEYYSGVNDQNDTQAQGIYKRGQVTKDMWVRLYFKFGSDYIPRAFHSKFFILDTGAYPRFYPMFIDGSRELGWSVENPAQCDYTTCNFPPNRASRPMQNNQWYCIETHAGMNTVGAADGMLETWIDGVQTVGYYNLTLRGPNVVNPNGNSSNAIFEYIQIYKQVGQAIGSPGSRYIDQVAAGNTRIGCTGGPPPDITPPASPSGLTFQ